MEPLIVLVGVTCVGLITGVLKGRPLRRLPTALRGGLAAMFLRPANGYVARWLTVPKTRQARALRDHGVLDAQ